ncbi:hypothetical protein BJ322DRAFT_551525 [Thelephora terrestris]|uniref:Uncharacterized protein n=1 Tax=Thelephora terrestris TaxID=56493 RepID=A0A9P6L9R4_9AGAM|nr:hypothetical protein BJ322DRAFT_551525 [Thelephora terrestris]
MMSSTPGEDDHFSADEDDGSGPFSDSAATSDADPFTFSTSFSRQLGDSTFDTFWDSGKLQAASGGEGERRHGSQGGSDLSDSGAFGDLGDSTGSNGYGEIVGTGSGEMVSSWDSWTMATASGSFAEDDGELSNRERQRQRRGSGGVRPSK